MRRLRRKVLVYQGFIISGAIILGCVAVLFFAVLPAAGTTKTLYDSMKQLEKEAAGREQKLSFLGSLSEGDVRATLTALLVGLPQDKAVPSMFATIESLAGQSGVSFDGMSLKSPGSLATESAKPAVSKKTNTGLMPFSVSVSGGYDEVRAFISRINQVRRLFDIGGFDLKRNEDGTAQVTITVEAYYQPLPTKLGSLDAPILPLSTAEEELLAKVIGYPDLSSVGPALSGSGGSRRNPFSAAGGQ